MSIKRWLDEASDADGFERSLLESGLDAEPPPRAVDEVWQQVLSAVAPPVGPGPGGGATGALAAAKGATVTTFGKGFLLGIAASVAVAGAERVMTHRSASTSELSAAMQPAPAPMALVARSPLAPVASPALLAPEAFEPSSNEPAPTSSRSVTSARFSASHAPVPAPAPSPVVALQGSVAAFPLPDAGPIPKSRLEEEAALLRRARAELRSGALAAAFGTLEASREKFSAPELYQEREALLIELLHRSGQGERARERARAFLARFPESPHAAAVRAFAGSSK
jgi:hypothetical protein